MAVDLLQNFLGFLLFIFQPSFIALYVVIAILLFFVWYFGKNAESFKYMKW